MVIEPEGWGNGLNFVQVRIKKNQNVLNVVNGFGSEDKFTKVDNLTFQSDNAFLTDRSIDDLSESLETSSSSQLSLTIVIVISAKLCIFVEHFDKKFGQVFAQVNSEGTDHVGEPFDDTL